MGCRKTQELGEQTLLTDGVINNGLNSVKTPYGLRCDKCNVADAKYVRGSLGYNKNKKLVIELSLACTKCKQEMKVFDGNKTVSYCQLEPRPPYLTKNEY